MSLSLYIVPFDFVQLSESETIFSFSISQNPFVYPNFANVQWKGEKEKENLPSQQLERIKCISDYTPYYTIVKKSQITD